MEMETYPGNSVIRSAQLSHYLKTFIGKYLISISESTVISCSNITSPKAICITQSLGCCIVKSYCYTQLSKSVFHLFSKLVFLRNMTAEAS